MSRYYGNRRWRSRRSYSSYSPRSTSGGVQTYENGHTRAAQELSERLGGTTEIVKRFLFGLNDRDRSRVFNRYEKLHGRSKRTYADSVFDKWKAGTVRMGGEIAARIYDLLPPLMPTAVRYEIAKVLWEKYSPSSVEHYRVGFDCETQIVVGTVQHCLLSKVVPKCIPEQLKGQFDWLSGDDVTVQEDLLGYLQQLETTVIRADAQHRIPMLVNMATQRGSMVSDFDQTYQVGKHVVHLHFSRRYKAIEYGGRLPDNELGTGCIVAMVVAAIVFVLYLIVVASQ
jgi:hypothetical protein